MDNCDCNIGYQKGVKGHVRGCEFYKRWMISVYEQALTKPYTCYNVLCPNFRHECVGCKPDFAGLIELLNNQ